MPGIAQVYWESILESINQNELDFIGPKALKEFLEKNKGGPWLEFYYVENDAPEKFSLSTNGFDNLQEFLKFLNEAMEAKNNGKDEYSTPKVDTYKEEQKRQEEQEEQREKSEELLESCKETLEVFLRNKNSIEESKNKLAADYFNKLYEDIEKWKALLIFNDDEEVVEIVGNLDDLKNINSALENWLGEWDVWCQTGKSNPLPAQYSGAKAVVKTQEEHKQSLERYNKIYRKLLSSNESFNELQNKVGGETYFAKLNKDIAEWEEFFVLDDDAGTILGIKDSVGQGKLEKMGEALDAWIDEWIHWNHVGLLKNPQDPCPAAYTGIEAKVGAEAAAVDDDAGHWIFELDPEAAQYVGSKAGAAKQKEVEEDELYIVSEHEEEVEPEDVKPNRNILFRKRIGAKLADLAKDRSLKAFGSTMDQETFNRSMQTWFEKVQKNNGEYPDVTCDVDQDWFRTTVKVNGGGDSLKKDEIRHKYDSQRGCPKITMTNPPDDQTIYLFMKSSATMAPLKMEASCGAEQAIRLFEASVLAGITLELTEQDKNALLASKYNDRYTNLLDLQTPKNAVLLEQFRNTVKLSEDYRLGLSQINFPNGKLVFSGKPGKS